MSEIVLYILHGNLVLFFCIYVVLKFSIRNLFIFVNILVSKVCSAIFGIGVAMLL